MHEGITVLAGRRPSLHAALLAAKIAGHSHINIDGTLIHTDRCTTPDPTPGVDLWWSGKHHHHGGNNQVISTPNGGPLSTSDARPGREHDTTGLGYEGEPGTFTPPVKRLPGITLKPADQQLNPLQAHARARAEQANAARK